jgi:transposase
MPKLLTVCLTPEQQEQLERIRDNDKRPYMRERASAILKIAEGVSGRQVALDGLLKQRKPDTIYDWLERYQSEGIAGLSIKPGRGRKPAFSPKYEGKEEAKEAILHTVRREPSSFGKSRSRWSLSLIADVCKWLQVNTPSGMSQLLKRLGISYKRGRSYIHSPDPYYQQKMDVIAQCLLKAWYAPEKYVLLYQDEFTIYRQPTLDRDYEQMGMFQPLARRSYRSDTQFRGMGALNAVTGQVTYHQASKANIRQLTVFYDMIVEDYLVSYPQLDTIYMVQDNWPVHYHPDLLIALQPQHFQFPIHVPGNWPNEPSAKARRYAEKRKAESKTKLEKLPIKILQLPTYASWANPIEKLWRWVRQSVIHLHRLSDKWDRLKQRIRDFILSFRKGSNELLRYVGLLPD